jgi:hypothetical protein
MGMLTGLSIYVVNLGRGVATDIIAESSGKYMDGHELGPMGKPF